MSSKDNEKNALDKSAMMTSRARNRTVMLSSDMTGQVRSLIQSNKGDEAEVEEAESDHGFVAPISFNHVAEGVKKKNQDNHDKTGLIGSTIQESFNDVEEDDIGLNGLKNVENYDRLTPVSIKEILNTKEVPKGRPVTSDTSTLIHQSHTSFDSDRENLLKSRKAMRRSRIVGFLISFDKDEYGEIVEIREGRNIVSSKYIEESEMLFIDDVSISNPHAVIKADKKGGILFLDQLSEAGSSVIRAGNDQDIDAVGSPVELRHGDIVRLGARYFIFCAVPKIAIQD